MWQDIERKKRRLDAIRPATARSLAVIEAWCDVELTYTSIAIEGATLTRTEVALVLDKGLTAAGRRIKDYLEALDHADALRFVRALARQERPIGEDDVRRIHAMVLARSDPAEAGAYSRHRRCVRGSPVTFPPPAEIPREMRAFGEWLERRPAEPRAAFEAHRRLVSVHPFGDGNGRTARLLMNLLLLRGGYPPVVIGPEQRAAYVEALETAQLGGGEDAHEAFMAGRLDASLTSYLEHLEKELEAREG